MVEVSLSLEGFSQRYDYSNYTEVSDFLGNPYDRTEFERIVNHRGARRGDVSISLLSPHRTRSILLPYRTRDFINTEGFSSWPFMSVIHWSEDPQGLWSLLVSYRSLTGYVSVTNLTVTMYGTTAIPEAVRRIPSECDVGCRGRCAAAGPTFCDSCRNFRNASTLECVDSCADGLEIHNGYCIDPLANNTYRYMPQSFSRPNVVDNTTNTTNGTGFLNRTLSLATSSLTRLSSLTSHPAPTTEPSVSSTMFSVTPSLTTGSRHVMTTMGVSPTSSVRPPLVSTSLLPSEAPSIHSASATSTVVVPTPTLSVSSALHAQTHWLLSLMCLCTVFVVLQLY